jgi:Tfp pilus assembly protein PilO
MNPFEMVVLIVAITAIASVLRAKYGVVRRGKGEEFVRPDNGENERLREELRTLKQRVAVLERIATENDRGITLDREIEALRNRD